MSEVKRQFVEKTRAAAQLGSGAQVSLAWYDMCGLNSQALFEFNASGQWEVHIEGNGLPTNAALRIRDPVYFFFWGPRDSIKNVVVATEEGLNSCLEVLTKHFGWEPVIKL